MTTFSLLGKESVIRMRSLIIPKIEDSKGNKDAITLLIDLLDEIGGLGFQLMELALIDDQTNLVLRSSRIGLSFSMLNRLTSLRKDLSDKEFEDTLIIIRQVNFELGKLCSYFLEDFVYGDSRETIK